MLAQFERKVAYLSDIAMQTQTKLVENMVEIKKILKMDILILTYGLLRKWPSSIYYHIDKFAHSEAVHNHCLNFKISW